MAFRTLTRNKNKILSDQFSCDDLFLTSRNICENKSYIYLLVTVNTFFRLEKKDEAYNSNVGGGGGGYNKINNIKVNLYRKCRRYMAEILPIGHKTQNNQSINIQKITCLFPNMTKEQLENNCLSRKAKGILQIFMKRNHQIAYKTIELQRIVTLYSRERLSVFEYPKSETTSIR